MISPRTLTAATIAFVAAAVTALSLLHRRGEVAFSDLAITAILLTLLVRERGIQNSTSRWGSE